MSSAREAQTFAGASLLVRYANFVKLPHTVFALPFALLGLLVASRDHSVTWRVVGLVVLAFTCARFVALAFNRIADRELDARNPRTRGRELPTGRLTLRQAWAAVLVAAAVFLWSAWALNPLCFALAPVALVFISAYSYAKRFTHWAHLWLGLADGVATPAGYLAVTGRWSDPWWLLPAGALAVTFWVGGFDICYATGRSGSSRWSCGWGGRLRSRWPRRCTPSPSSCCSRSVRAPGSGPRTSAACSWAPRSLRGSTGS